MIHLTCLIDNYLFKKIKLIVPSSNTTSNITYSTVIFIIIFYTHIDYIPITAITHTNYSILTIVYNKLSK